MTATKDLIELSTPLGEDFLIWLWHQALEAGGISGIDGDDTAIYVDESMQLVAPSGDVQLVALKKGNPAESREAFEALARGMRPAKASFRLLIGDQEWKFGLVAATLEIQGAKLPKSSSKDPVGLVADRIDLLNELSERIRSRFACFVTARMEDPEAMGSTLQAWIEKGAGNA